MSNITNLNRDYLIKINVKEATIDVPKMTFWNTDKKTSNMFVQLVINMSTNELISQYVTVQNATDYKITLNVIKPKTKQYKTIEATLLNEEKALFEIDLPDEFTDQVGDYSFEFEVSSKVDSNDESITTSNGTYKVNGSILTNLNQEISSSPDLPILKQLIEQVKQLQGGDLTDYQKKEDETLETTSKKVVGAINEVNSQFKDIAKKIEQGGTGDGKGLTQIQITALDNMFKVCAYDSNKNVNSAYNAFKTAFNISSGGGTVDPEPVEKTKYTITNNLTDITTNNTTSEIEEGSTYKAILSTSVNYAIKTITIIMGEKDVTSIVYADGVINIGSVTGNIVITATAESIKVTPESLGFETLFEYDDVYNKDAVVAKYGTNGLVTYNYTGAVTVACYYNSVNNTSPAPNMNNVFDGRAYGSITYMTNGDGTKSGGVKKLKSDLITSYAYKTGKTPKCYGCYATGTNSGKIQIFANQYKPIDVETPSVDTHVRILIIKGTSITAEQLCTIFGI